MKLRVTIVDDEAMARARIRQLLKDEDDIEIVAECANGKQAVEAVRRDKPDVVLLDVQMPGLDGFEVCRRLARDETNMPLVIFVTAYDRYALKAFEVHALDYLLKPFDRDRLVLSLNHARKQLEARSGVDIKTRFEKLLQDVQLGASRPNRLALKEDGKIVLLRPDAIDWVEADGNYVRIHHGAESHFVRETLSAIEAELASDQFMRISRSVIVNLDRIKEIQPLFYGDHAVILNGGEKLTLSRKYRERLELMLSRWR